jgi:stalled ribosome rescue protein Dom34
MTTIHAAVWLDHNVARIFHLTPDEASKQTIESPSAHTRLHRKSGPGADDGRRVAEDPRYYAAIVEALGSAKEILVIGPANAKHELVKYTEKMGLRARVAGVESADHPSDGQVVARAREYFAAYDAMHGS